MARPFMAKRICKLPKYIAFAPVGTEGEPDCMTLSLEEYEAIRLIDLEGISREECAHRMKISRATAQTIYNSAKRKVASCLVEGKVLHIEGGNIELCTGDAGCPICGRKQIPSPDLLE